ncbi:MAG: hypothetical protein B7X76_02580, partial [Azorhizobium sp. 39-67-5]
LRRRRPGYSLEAPFYTSPAIFAADMDIIFGRHWVVTQLDEATRDGLSLSPKTLEGIGQAEARRAFWGNAALWVIALSLLVIALR